MEGIRTDPKGLLAHARTLKGFQRTEEHSLQMLLLDTLGYKLMSAIREDYVERRKEEIHAQTKAEG